MSSRSDRIYLTHIQRLQDRNRLLAECLADERRLRKNAYAHYQRRIDSKFFWCIDVMTEVMRSASPQIIPKK